MRYLYVDENSTFIPLGRVGENNALCVAFKKFKDFEGGTYSLVCNSSSPVITEGEEYVNWIVTSEDTATAGDGRCQLVYTGEDFIAKSPVYRTEVYESLQSSDTP